MLFDGEANHFVKKERVGMCPQFGRCGIGYAQSQAAAPVSGVLPGKERLEIDARLLPTSNAPRV